MKNKDFILRANGMEYALKIAKEKGIEGLEKEIKMRNMIGLPLRFSKSELDEFWTSISENLYNNMLTTVAYILNQHYGFGKKRLRDFRDYFNKAVNDTLSLDYMGEHYVRLEDYAVYMNENYNLGIDVNRVAYCQDNHDECNNKQFHMMNVERACKELEEAGMNAAAEFLMKKVS